MAAVNETVTELIRRIPCAVSSRTAALRSILAVSGSGYEWRGGQVVPRVRDDRTCLESVHARFKVDDPAARARYLSYGYEKLSAMDGTCPAEALRRSARTLALVRQPLARYGGAASLGALMFNVPPDVRRDWRRAVVEIAGDVLPSWENPDPAYLAQANEYTEGQRLAAIAAARALRAGEEGRGQWIGTK